MKIRFIVWVALSTCLLSCSDDSEPFERIINMRPIGVSSDKPLISSIDFEDLDSIQINLQVVVVLPEADSIESIEVFEDTENIGLKVSPVLVEGSGSYLEAGKLKIYTHDAIVPILKLEENIIEKSNGIIKLNYGFKISSGEKEEKVIGEIRYISDSLSGLNWQRPSVTINDTTGSTDSNGHRVLSANVESENNERLKFSWYVSSGKIKNRTGKETSWEEAGTGSQTVIAAVYGVNSRYFNYVYTVKEL